jgi:hypothetical protein
MDGSLMTNERIVRGLIRARLYVLQLADVAREKGIEGEELMNVACATAYIQDAINALGPVEAH